MKSHVFLASEHKLFWVFTPVAAAFVAWGLGSLGAFDVTDGPAYDWLLRATLGIQRQPPRVLLVDASEGVETDDARLTLLLESLERLRPRRVVFTFLPPTAAAEFYRSADSYGNVVLPWTLAPDPFDPSSLKPREVPELRAYPGLRFGVARAPPTAMGISRSQHASFDGGYPSLEVRAAYGEEPGPLSCGVREALIDFRGGPGSLPNVSMGRVISGDLIDDIVKDKIVLVGLERTIVEPGVSTPTTAGGESMTFLEFQGHAIDSFASGMVLSRVPGLARLGALAGIACLWAWACRRAGMRVAAWASAAALLAGAGMAFLLFAVWRTWLPVTEMAATQVALLVVMVRQRAMRLTVSAAKLVEDSSAHLREKYWPVNVQSQGATWSLVANMINQTLDLNRLIFLSADGKARHLTEILALHCSLDDLRERRRDYTRPPYSDAIRAKGPIPVDGFLTTSEANEKQFLIPLRFYDDLLGFWALGIDGTKMASIPEFDALLRDYTLRISELLYNARQPTRGIADDTTTGGERTHQGLAMTLDLLQQRLGSLDALVNSLSSGIIVFDIFGRILQINEVMLGLLKKENLAPFEMTALDLIMALSDCDVSRARKLLRRVIVENSHASLPVSFRSMSTSRFLLHLKPLVEAVKDKRSKKKEGTARGVLCELVETTSMAMLYEMKSRLTDRLCLQLRNDLAPISLSWSVIGAGSGRGGEQVAVAEAIQTKVKDAVHMLSECQHYLSLDSDVDDLERFPVDPKDALKLALEEVRITLPSHRVEFETLEPNFVSYVFASTTKLKELFKAVFLVLSQDASEGSKILVRVTESGDVVAFDFSNMGFGIPNELLQEYIFGDSQATTAELQTIQTGAKWVQSWGGVLEAFSGVGMGMHFTVHLVKFI